MAVAAKAGPPPWRVMTMEPAASPGVAGVSTERANVLEAPAARCREVADRLPKGTHVAARAGELDRSHRASLRSGIAEDECGPLPRCGVCDLGVAEVPGALGQAVESLLAARRDERQAVARCEVGRRPCCHIRDGAVESSLARGNVELHDGEVVRGVSQLHRGAPERGVTAECPRRERHRLRRASRVGDGLVERLRRIDGANGVELGRAVEEGVPRDLGGTRVGGRGLDRGIGVQEPGTLLLAGRRDVVGGGYDDLLDHCRRGSRTAVVLLVGLDHQGRRPGSERRRLAGPAGELDGGSLTVLVRAGGIEGGVRRAQRPVQVPGGDDVDGSPGLVKAGPGQCADVVVEPARDRWVGDAADSGLGVSPIGGRRARPK